MQGDPEKEARTTSIAIELELDCADGLDLRKIQL
jgi:hypothetical protein